MDEESFLMGPARSFRSLEATEQCIPPCPTSDQLMPVRRWNSAGELTALFGDWRAEFPQLKPGPVQTQGHMTCTGSMSISLLSFDSPMLCRIQPRAGFVSIVVPSPRSHGLSFRGQELSSAHCVVIDEGADAELVSRGRLEGVMIAVNTPDFTRMGAWSSSAGKAGAHLTHPGMHRTGILTMCIAWVFDTLSKYPAAANFTALQSCLNDLVLWSLRLMLEDFRPTPQSSRREQSGRRAAVERARRYIHENLANPIRLSEVCAHAHTQARSLEYGFNEVTGVSPVAYIKALRLNRLHQLLSSPASIGRTITEIALDCGFWHLSQFAADYRKFFGESPSAARRRSHAPETLLAPAFARQPEDVGSPMSAAARTGKRAPTRFDSPKPSA